MSHLPMLQWYPRDWIADTRHLTLEQRGAHFELINFAWCRPRPELPDDDAELAVMLGITVARFHSKIRPAVSRLWHIADGVWSQKRLTVEHQKALKKVEVSRQNGAKGRRPPNEGNQTPNEPSGFVTGSLPARDSLEPEPELEPEEKIPPRSPPAEPVDPEPQKATGADAPITADGGDAPTPPGTDVVVEFPAKAKPPAPPAPSKPAIARAMLEVWNTECGQLLPRATALSAQRQAGLLARWRDRLGGDLDRWRAHCRRVMASPFLTGQVSSEDREPFFARVDWVAKPGNFDKIAEGNYDRRDRAQAASPHAAFLAQCDAHAAARWQKQQQEAAQL